MKNKFRCDSINDPDDDTVEFTPSCGNVFSDLGFCAYLTEEEVFDTLLERELELQALYILYDSACEDLIEAWDYEDSREDAEYFSNRNQ